MDGEFVKVCYKCIYNALLIKKFGEVKMEILNFKSETFFLGKSGLKNKKWSVWADIWYQY